MALLVSGDVLVVPLTYGASVTVLFGGEVIVVLLYESTIAVALFVSVGVVGGEVVVVPLL